MTKVVQPKSQTEYESILLATRRTVQQCINTFQLQHENTVPGLKLDIIKHIMQQTDVMNEEILVTMKGIFHSDQQVIGSTKLLTALCKVIGETSSIDMRMKAGETSISIEFISVDSR